MTSNSNFDIHGDDLYHVNTDKTLHFRRNSYFSRGISSNLTELDISATNTHNSMLPAVGSSFRLVQRLSTRRNFLQHEGS